MSQMNDHESIDLFCESLKKAASSARQLASVTKDKSWLQIATGFDMLRDNGEKIYKRASPTQAERLRMVDRMVEKQIIDQGSNSVQ